MAALEGANSGATFKQTQSWTFTGGEIPKGKQKVADSTAVGSLRSANARFSYTFNGSRAFDMVIADGQLYVRPRKGKTWRSASEDDLADFYPALRFDILKEAVLVGKSITKPGIDFTGSTVTRRYVVVPTSDQLQQLQGISVAGSGLADYLKTASASIAIYLTTSGNKLARIVVHLSGVDPVNGERVTIDSTVDFKLSSKVGPIRAPDGAVPVSPEHLLDPP